MIIADASKVLQRCGKNRAILQSGFLENGEIEMKRSLGTGNAKCFSYK